MTLLRLAFARSLRPRRTRLSNARIPSLLQTRPPATDSPDDFGFIPLLPRRLFRISLERLAAARNANGEHAAARLLAFDAAYVLVAAAATGDELAGLRPPDSSVAAKGVKLLGMSADDQELAMGLAGIYRLHGWEALDLDFLLGWAQLVTQFARRFEENR